MTTTLDRETPSPAAPAAPAAGTPQSTRVIAGGLWVFVSGLLVYGIVETAIKAAALFS